MAVLRARRQLLRPKLFRVPRPVRSAREAAIPGTSVSSRVSPPRPEKSPRAEQLLQQATGGGINRACLFGHLTVLENSEYDAINAECCQSLGIDLELHSISP